MSAQSDWAAAVARVAASAGMGVAPQEILDAQANYEAAEAALAAEQLAVKRATVTRLQALLALEAGGYLATVDAYMATLARGDSSRLAWENAQVFERSSPVVAAMGAMLGLDDVAIDALFTAASNI
jgi:hypothetical protein